MYQYINVMVILNIIHIYQLTLFNKENNNKKTP